jgi:hypothetical protein
MGSRGNRGVLALTLGIVLTTFAGPSMAAGTTTSCGTWRPVWSPNPSPPGWQDSLADVAVLARDNVSAVGTASAPDRTRDRALAERWDGSEWTALSPVSPAKFSRLQAVAAIDATSAWAVGSAGDDSFHTHPLIQRLSGDTWTAFPVPPIDGAASALVDVDVVSATDAWAVGWAYEAFDEHHSAPLTMHWDGSEWTVMYTGGRSAVDMRSPTDGWAVGYADSLGGDYAYITRWDGTAWRYSANFSLDWYLADIVAVSGTEALAVGSADRVGRPLVLRWNGRSWVRLRAPALDDVSPAWLNALTATPDGTIYAVGGRRNAAGEERPFVVRWNGTTWSRMPVSTSSRSPHLAGVVALSDHRVIAVGDRKRGDRMLTVAVDCSHS